MLHRLALGSPSCGHAQANRPRVTSRHRMGLAYWDLWAALSPIEAVGGPAFLAQYRDACLCGINTANGSAFRISALSIPLLAALSLYGGTVGIADLDPNRAPTGSVGAIHPLRDDALGSDAAGVHEDRRAILGDVLVEEDPRIRAIQDRNGRRRRSSPSCSIRSKA